MVQLMFVVKQMCVFGFCYLLGVCKVVFVYCFCVIGFGIYVDVEDCCGGFLLVSFICFCIEQVEISYQMFFVIIGELWGIGCLIIKVVVVYDVFKFLLC